MSEKRYLECQTCEDVVQELSMAQAQIIADRPYDFIVYCREHRDSWKEDARRDGLLSGGPSVRL